MMEVSKGKKILVFFLIFILVAGLVFVIFLYLDKYGKVPTIKEKDNFLNTSCPNYYKVSGFTDNGSLICSSDLTGGSSGGVGGIASESDPYWIASYSLFNDSWSYTFNQTTNDSLNNYINTKGKSYPLSINLTAGTYNGSFVNGTKIGYSAGNSICNTEFIGSHLCNEFEITSWFANTNNINLQNNTDFWIISGSPKYVPADHPVDDCKGFTSSTTGATDSLGNYWHFENSTGGNGRAINCATMLSLCCASYT